MDKLKKINLGYCTINQKSKVQITITCSQRTLRELILKLKLINLALLKFLFYIYFYLMIFCLYILGKTIIHKNK
jgi:hypothetical protein